MTPDSRPDTQLDVSELRARLRGLGYLDAGVDRFVLAPAHSKRGSLDLAWRVSLRIGVLAALLLGPAAAVGVAMRVPGLLAGARDAVVITTYLALIFGAAATAAAFVAALIVRAVARRYGETVSRRIGIAMGWLVGLASLAYLTLWWNATGASWGAPTRTLLALAAAVAISLLLGHAVMIAALALSARERPIAARRAPAVSWRAMVALGLLAFFGSSGLLAWSSTRSARPAPQPFAVVPTGVRVVVIGIDGFDPQLFKKWSESAAGGAAPILRRLTIPVSAGRAFGDPASTWTTVATGVPAEQHGVSGMESRRVFGLQGLADPRSPLARALGDTTDLLRLTRPAPMSGLSRRYKMMWETAAEKGLNTAVVNWWATWPASRTGGIVLSDRAVLRLDMGGEPSGEIAPPALYAPLRHRWPEISRRAAELAKPFGYQPNPALARVLSRSARLDAEQALLARDTLLGSPDLLAVYLPGLDIAQYELLQGLDSRATSPSAIADRLAVLPAYYVFLDLLIRETLLRDLARDTVVMIVAHPGRLRSNQAAVLSITGGPVRVEGTASTASLMDVAPSVLYLLGLPVSRELAGRPWLEWLDPQFVRRYPVREVESYGAYMAEVPAEAGKVLDSETLERLRSLGYIR